MTSTLFSVGFRDVGLWPIHVFAHIVLVLLWLLSYALDGLSDEQILSEVDRRMTARPVFSSQVAARLQQNQAQQQQQQPPPPPPPPPPQQQPQPPQPAAPAPQVAPPQPQPLAAGPLLTCLEAALYNSGVKEAISKLSSTPALAAALLPLLLTCITNLITIFFALLAVEAVASLVSTATLSSIPSLWSGVPSRFINHVVRTRVLAHDHDVIELALQLPTMLSHVTKDTVLKAAAILLPTFKVQDYVALLGMCCDV